jgi:hypothetical protein
MAQLIVSAKFREYPACNTVLTLSCRPQGSWPKEQERAA